MTITSSGLSCDVCGKYILLDEYEEFSVSVIDQRLHCHASTCKQIVIDAGTDWHNLPAGPLRAAFESAS